MALVFLKDVKVVALFKSGVKVVESSTSKAGKDYEERWTLWSTDLGVQVGDVIANVSGFLGAKVGKPWTGNDGTERVSVELSVNSPRIDASQPGGSIVSPEQPQGDPWVTTPIPGDVAPDNEYPEFDQVPF